MDAGVKREAAVDTMNKGEDLQTVMVNRSLAGLQAGVMLMEGRMGGGREGGRES